MSENRNSEARRKASWMSIALVAFSVLFFTASSALAQPPGDTQPLREAAYSPAQAPAQSTADSDYRLGSGDKVRISVFNQRELTDIYQVDGLGHIAFPLVGQIDAGGLTPRQLEEKVAKVLSPDYVRNPHVSVVVLTYRPFYIIGEVTKPGSYPYMSGMTVLTAAAQAGGFTYRADEDSFDLQRPGADGKKKKIDAKPDTPVQPGDIITVNERIF